MTLIEHDPRNGYWIVEHDGLYYELDAPDRGDPNWKLYIYAAGIDVKNILSCTMGSEPKLIDDPEKLQLIKAFCRLVS